MKNMTRWISLILTVVLLICSIGTVSFAASYSDEENESQSSGQEPVVAALPGFNDQICLDSGGNQYSGVIWPTLAAAKCYYGTGHTYYQCNQSYGGSLYNYYYCFSDGLKMFFRVSQ